jgi:hypothetical protein
MYKKMAEKVKSWSSDQEKKGSGANDFKLPRDVSFFKPHKVNQDDKFIINRLDLVPYIVTVDNHPKAKKGEPYWTKKFYRHRGLGADHRMSLICPSTIGKPCPICDFRRELAKEKGWKDDEVSQLRAQEVDLFNVMDKDDLSKGVQLYSVSFGNFGKKFKEEIDAEPDNIYCVLPTKEGKTLIARFTEEKFGSGTYFECSKLDFKNRKEDIDEKYLKQAIDLDVLPIIKSFQEIEAILLGLEGTEKKKEEDKEEDLNEDDKKSNDDDDDEKLEEDETEDEPEDKSEKKKTMKRGDGKKKSGDCPSDHEFGKDYNKKDECDDCPEWEACAEERDNQKRK